MHERVRRPARHRSILLAFALLAVAAPSMAGQGLPARLTDQQFWKLVSESSEPNGFFQSDNLVSNETTMQEIIPELVKHRAPGGVYLGVGPDQNFTYIAAMRPRIAFIIDIRREAVMQHLMYKALFEMAADRAEFLSLLLARPRPAGLTTASPGELVDAYFRAVPDTALYWKTLRAIEHRLQVEHGFGLDRDDIESIRYVYTSFHLEGLDITYSFGTGGRGGGRGMPSLADLILSTDASGRNQNFLANEEIYGVVRQMQLNNLVVPVVGDFGGPRAVRAVGEFLRQHGAVVSAIYTSNVEQYLFRDPDKWRAYYANVATMPLDSNSTFVRSVFNSGGRSFGGFGARSVTVLQPVQQLLQAVRDGLIQTYTDVISMSRTVW